MFIMIRRGQAGQVASLFFLIPGVSALMGFVLLGERLEPLALAGFALSAVAVCGAVAKR
jgi:drug/metabolite transporter (DMT)-like permease